jgi:amino acid transporter
MKTTTWVIMIIAFFLLIGALILSAVVTGYVSMASDGNSLSQDEINTVYALSIVTAVTIGLTIVTLLAYIIWWFSKTRNVLLPDDPGYSEAMEKQKRNHQRDRSLMNSSFFPNDRSSGRSSVNMGGYNYEPGRISMSSQDALNQTLYGQGQ